MSKYDYGGGCPCGLFRSCIPQCEYYKGEVAMFNPITNRFEENAAMDNKSDSTRCECGENKYCNCNDEQPSIMNVGSIPEYDDIPEMPVSTTKKEAVNHPEHYNPGVYEAINVIEHYNLGFHLGNSVKYILRAGKKHKNIKEDIEKAIWYLERYKEKL